MLWELIVNIVLAAAAGFLLERYLQAHPLKMSRYLLGATVLGCAVVAWWILGYEGAIRWLAVGLSLLAALGGYALATWQMHRMPDPRPVPELVRRRDDPGDGHTAVVYFTHGEPETYSPIGWVNQFKEFDEQGISFIPFLVRPLFVKKLRDKYLQVGRSEHRHMHGVMLKQLESLYRAEGDTTTRFYLSFLDDNPRPDAALIQALNDGASRVVVAEVFLTVSNHTAEGEEMVRRVAERVDVPVIFTTPLWDAPALKQMFVERANAHLGDTARDRAAVMLVGHGQPHEWDLEWPTETEHEMAFREDVLELLRADGYKGENLASAWMEFREPKPAPKLEEFSRNGVEKVLYFSAAISADAIHSQYDVPELVEAASLSRPMEMVNLGAWNDDPLVIQSIKTKIDEKMARVRMTA